MAAKNQKQWTVLGTDKGLDGLVLSDAPVPAVGDNEVLVKLRAASLNYRDLIIPKGQYPFPARFPVVAASDGAGEVVEVGAKVSRFSKGDRVVTLFNQGHQFGPVDQVSASTGLGGAQDGTLRQYGVFNENGVVRAPATSSMWNPAPSPAPASLAGTPSMASSPSSPASSSSSRAPAA